MAITQQGWRAGTSSGGGGGSDEKVKISSADTTTNFLENKLVAGTNITLNKLNTGANEQIEIVSSGSGLATGIIGIPDGSGWYTFYASLNLALASAVIGDTIIFFDNYTESTTGTLLKSGVDINLNGHTYTLDTADAQDTLSNVASAGKYRIYNGVIKRQNAVPNDERDGVVLRIDTASSELILVGVEVIQESDACVVYGTGKPIVNGGVYRGGSATFQYTALNLSWTMANATWFMNEELILNDCTSLNCIFYQLSNKDGVTLTNTAKLFESFVSHVGNASAGFYALQISGSGAVAQNVNVQSNTSDGILVSGGSLYDSAVRVSDEIACRVANGSYVSNVSAVSRANYGLYIDRSEVHNSYSETTTGSSSVFIGQDSTLFNSSIISNNASGVGIFLNASSNKISKCTIGMSNVTGNAIDGNALGVFAQIVNNVADNSLGALINTTNITNIQVFTQDGFGNILIG